MAEYKLSSVIDTAKSVNINSAYLGLCPQCHLKNASCHAINLGCVMRPPPLSVN
jgi:hypothetical protein